MWEKVLLSECPCMVGTVTRIYTDKGHKVTKTMVGIWAWCSKMEHLHFGPHSEKQLLPMLSVFHAKTKRPQEITEVQSGFALFTTQTKTPCARTAYLREPGGHGTSACFLQIPHVLPVASVCGVQLLINISYLASSTYTGHKFPF